MSVVGFDIGNSNCYVAIARAGGIDTVDNDASDRCTPCVVSFDAKVRLTGNSAKSQMSSNVKNTITNIKRLIGRNAVAGDAILNQELAEALYTVIPGANGEALIQVQYQGEQRLLTCVQVMAMMLQELRGTASRNLKAPVTDCVISVPSYFTDCQRKEMLTAAQIVGLNCLKLMNETTAVALCYGLFKQDLPAAEEPARKVAFVDFGQSSLQVCICAFNKGKVKVLSVASDPSLGGRDFDNRIGEYMAKDFKTKPGIDVRGRPKAWLRLLKDIETVKKKVSSVKTDVPLNIECLMDDYDVSHRLNRETLEKECSDLFARVKKPLEEALRDSGLKVEDIYAVEVVGGSVRMPLVRQIIQDTFQKECSTTLNGDEAVARGCAIQCAMLSHSIRVRDIEVLDACAYPYQISWSSEAPGITPDGSMLIFDRHHSYPATKMITLQRAEPFTLRCRYPDDAAIHHTTRDISTFHISGVQPTDEGEPNKVKVKVRVNSHGCFGVTSATMVEKLPTPPPSPEKEEPMETSAVPNGEPATPLVNGDAGEPAAPLVNGDAAATESTETMDTESTDKPAAPATEPSEAAMKSVDDESVTSDAAGETKAEPAVATAAAEPTTKAAKKKKPLTKQTDLLVATTEGGHCASPTAERMQAYKKEEEAFVKQLEIEMKKAQLKNDIEEYVYRFREAISEERLLAPFVDESEAATFNVLLEQSEEWLYDEGDDTTIEIYEAKLKALKDHGTPLETRYRLHSELPESFSELGSSMTHYRKIVDAYSNGDEKYVHLAAEEMEKVVKKLDDKFDWLNKSMIGFSNTLKTKTPETTATLVASVKKEVDDFCNPIVSKKKPKVEPPKDVKTDAENKPPPADTTGAPPSTENTPNDTPADPENNGNAAMDTGAQPPPTKTNLDMEID